MQKREKKREKTSTINVEQIFEQINQHLETLEENLEQMKKIFYPSEEGVIELSKTASIFHLPKMVQRYIFQYLPVEGMAAIGSTCKAFGKIIFQMMEEKKKKVDEAIQQFKNTKNSLDDFEGNLTLQESILNKFKSQLMGLMIVANFNHSIPDELRGVFKLKNVKIKRSKIKLILDRNVKSEFSEKIPFELAYLLTYPEITLNRYNTKVKKNPSLTPKRGLKNEVLYNVYQVEISFKKYKTHFNNNQLSHFLKFFTTCFNSDNLSQFLFEIKEEPFVSNYFLNELSDHPSFAQLPLAQLIPALLQRVMDQKKRDLEEEKRKLEFVEKDEKKKHSRIEMPQKKLRIDDFQQNDQKIELMNQKYEMEDEEEEEFYEQEMEDDYYLDGKSYKSRSIPSSTPPQIARLEFNSISIFTFIFRKICSQLKINFPRKDDSVDLDLLSHQAWDCFSSLQLDTQLLPLDNLKCEQLNSLLLNNKAKEIFLDQILKILMIRSSYNEHFFPRNIVNHFFFFFFFFQFFFSTFFFQAKSWHDFLHLKRIYFPHSHTFSKKKQENKRKMGFSNSLKTLYVLLKFPQVCFSLDDPFLPILSSKNSFLTDFDQWINQCLKLQILERKKKKNIVFKSKIPKKEF